MVVQAQVLPNEEKTHVKEIVRTPYWVAKIAQPRSAKILVKIKELDKEGGDAQAFLNHEFRKIVQFADQLEETIPDDTSYDESVQAIINAWLKSKSFHPTTRQKKITEK